METLAWKVAEKAPDFQRIAKYPTRPGKLSASCNQGYNEDTATNLRYARKAGQEQRLFPMLKFQVVAGISTVGFCSLHEAKTYANPRMSQLGVSHCPLSE